jgi:hypothetical protein
LGHHPCAFCVPRNPQEFQRLSKVAADKGVSPVKRETFEWKVNVLRSFMPATKEAPGGGGTQKDEL